MACSVKPQKNEYKIILLISCMKSVLSSCLAQAFGGYFKCTYLINNSVINRSVPFLCSLIIMKGILSNFMGFESPRDFDGQFLSKLSGNINQVSRFLGIHIYITDSPLTFVFRSSADVLMVKSLKYTHSWSVKTMLKSINIIFFACKIGHLLNCI